MAVGQAGERVVTMTAVGDEIEGTKIVEQLRWASVTAGDELKVVDSADKIVWEALAGANNYTDVIIFGPSMFDGLKVETIGSGTLYVYLA